MIKTLKQIQVGREAERMFKKRDPEGKFIFNNILLNGHAHMLEYILAHWLEAHANLPLTLEGNFSVLHQALAKASYVLQDEPDSKSSDRKNSDDGDQLSNNGPENDEEKAAAATPKKVKKKKFELPLVTEGTFIRMVRLLVEAEAQLSGAGIDVDKHDRLGRTPLHLAVQFGLTGLTKELLKSKA